MQELFPEEADQAHYLTVMINRWAWRTPSPGRDAATPTPTPTSTDEDTVITRCGKVSGEGEGVPLGQGTESARVDMSVPTGKFSLDKFKKSHLKEEVEEEEEEDLVVEEEEGGVEELWVTEDNGGALQACGPCLMDPALAAEGAAGSDGGIGEDGECYLSGDGDVDDFTVVVNVDSSRAASLTRTCRWAGYKKLPDGCELTVAELREMANRQQQQIETQQQLLVAREQRLKFLKQQENRQQQVAAEAERLRRLRERVEAQELKLRKLRALRGQVDNHRLNTSTLTNDLEAMRALFSEKEKELVLAVAKVEELTHQLEDLRNGRSNLHTNNQHHNELDKLRRELLYHNSVNREASARVASQRETLSARREEITRIDKRIAELQQRLHRKRLLNQQLASQITAATQAKQAHLKAVQQKAALLRRHDGSPAEEAAHTHDHLKVPPGEDLGEFGPNKQDPKYQTLPYNTKFSVTFKTKTPMGSGESGDSAPPTPTTPVPPPFPGAPPPHQENQGGSGGCQVPPLASVAAAVSSSTSASNSTGGSTGVVTQTVHSIPTHPPSRGHALAPPQPQQIAQQPPTTQQGSNNTQHTAPPQLKPVSSTNAAMTPRVYGPGATAAAFNLATTTSRSQPLFVGTAAAQDVENVRALGGSSMVLSNNNNSNSSNNHHSSNSSLNNLHNSDGVATDDVGEVIGGGGGGGTSLGRAKPALPPKPNVPSKPLPPPRQKGDNSLGGSTESLPGAGATRTSQVKGPQPYRYASQNVIMSTYTQQPSTSSLESSSTTTTTITTSTSTTSTSSSSSSTPCSSSSCNNEASEDKNSKQLNNNNITVNNNNNHQQVSGGKESAGDGEKVHVSISRRIEMPPDFMFPEDETPPSDLLGRRRRLEDDIDTPPSSGTSHHHHHHLHHNHHHHQESTNNNNNNNSNGESQDVVDRAIPYSDMEKLCLKDDTKGGGGGGFENTKVADDSRQPDGADTREPHEEGRSTTGENDKGSSSGGGGVVRRMKKGNLRTKNSAKVTRRVSFDPLALLLDASLEGELELVKRTAMEVPNPSAANDEGITALHNAICAGHLDIVTFLVTFGCDVNAQDSDGWTPLHCAASCNNVAMVRFLVEHGACILATTLSDHETAAEKCEQDEEGYDGCSQYLYSVQEKLGIMNGGVVYGVYEYQALAADELSFNCGDAITILRRGDEYEREWWWGQLLDKQGYVPRNLLGLYPRVTSPERDT